MPNLVILKASDPESLHSSEFRDLWAQVESAARTLVSKERITDVQVLLDPTEVPTELGDHDFALLLGPENVLLTAASLDAMLTAARSTGVVRPARLADVDLAAFDFPYSLRGFERIEARALDGSLTLPPPLPPLPALISIATLRSIVATMPLAEILTGSAIGDLPSATAGLCHAFIDYYGEVRLDLLPFVPKDATEILEVGCGRGATGAYLQAQLGCRVTGVELNPEVAKDAAQRLHAVLVGDLEKLDISGRFDVVLGSEIVEHLPAADQFLARARSLLRPGGSAVFSIPNVGHWSVVDDLLAGRWDYLPIGLLCFTHFRFFTEKTLADWLVRAGFSSWQITRQKTSVPARFEALAATASLGFDVDLESLGTQGFYVVARG